MSLHMCGYCSSRVMFLEVAQEDTWDQFQKPIYEATIYKKLGRLIIIETYFQL